MKTTTFSLALTLILSTALPGTARAANEDCEAAAAKVKSTVSADRSKVLIAVEDALTANPDCACETVKTAIEAADADKALVKQIVITAVNAAQGEAATIMECAVAVAPEASKEIKEGMKEALGETGEGLGEAGIPVSVTGVYAISPVGPATPAASQALLDARGTRVVVERRPAADRKKLTIITIPGTSTTEFTIIEK